MVEELSEYLLVDILYRAVDTTCPKYTLTTAHKFASVCKKWRQAALSDYAIYLIWSKVDPMAMYMSYLVSNLSRTRDLSEHPKVDFFRGGGKLAFKRGKCKPNAIFRAVQYVHDFSSLEGIFRNPEMRSRAVLGDYPIVPMLKPTEKSDIAVKSKSDWKNVREFYESNPFFRCAVGNVVKIKFDLQLSLLDGISDAQKSRIRSLSLTVTAKQSCLMEGSDGERGMSFKDHLYLGDSFLPTTECNPEKISNLLVDMKSLRSLKLRLCNDRIDYHSEMKILEKLPELKSLRKIKIGMDRLTFLDSCLVLIKSATALEKLEINATVPSDVFPVTLRSLVIKDWTKTLAQLLTRASEVKSPLDRLSLRCDSPVKLEELSKIDFTLLSDLKKFEVDFSTKLLFDDCALLDFLFRRIGGRLTVLKITNASLPFNNRKASELPPTLQKLHICCTEFFVPDPSIKWPRNTALEFEGFSRVDVKSYPGWHLFAVGSDHYFRYVLTNSANVKLDHSGLLLNCFPSTTTPLESVTIRGCDNPMVQAHLGKMSEDILESMKYVSRKIQFSLKSSRMLVYHYEKWHPREKVEHLGKVLILK